MQALSIENLNEEISAVYCPHQSFRSARFAKKIKTKVRVAYANWWNRFYFNHRIIRPMQYPEVFRQLILLSVVDPKWFSRMHEVTSGEVKNNFINLSEQNTVRFNQIKIPNWASLELPRNEIEISTALKKFELPEEYVTLAPGSVWATKRWPYYQELAHKLSQKNQKIILLGAPDERDMCEEIKNGNSNIINLAGSTSLYEVYLILNQAKYLICNDSGLMHMAAAANTKILAVFGPTTLSLGFRPWSENATLIQKSLKCRPCGLHGHKACPIGTHECMKSISADLVLQSL